MPKNCWILAAIALVCLGSGESLAATNAPYAVDVWDVDTANRLPQNVVLALTQTRDGYLWLGTLNGLARFDGLHFTTFNEGNTPGLDNNRILRLFEDSEGNLWMGTEGGVFLVKQGQVSRLAFGQETREDRLVSICEDRTGAVWLYTADGQLGRYRQGQLDTWQIPAPTIDQWRSMIADSSGLLWIGAGIELFAIDPTASHAAGKLPPKIHSLPVPFLDKYIVASKQGGYWLLANGHIRKWEGKRFDDLGLYPWDRLKTPVNAACEDQQGNLIVGTGGEGVFWFDAQGHHLQLTSAAGGLSHDTIRSLCVDHEGELWVGTDGRGLNRVKPRVFEVLEGTDATTVQSICPDGQGGLWIGYFAERLDHWTNGVLTRVGRPLAPGSDQFAVKSVLADDRQTVWVGTLRRGLLQVQNGAYVRAPGSGLLTPDHEIAALYQDREKRLWAGTQAGLARWVGQEWELRTNALTATGVRAIAEDREGNLWLGTYAGGLVCVRPAGLSCYGKADGLPSASILSLCADAEGGVWVGTAGGLARFKAGRWTAYAGRRDLADASINYLLEDDRGFLWIGSNAGLMRVRKRDLNNLADGSTNSLAVRTYGKADGLPTSQCSEGSQPAACRTADGTLWFPTISGLAFVNPARLTRNTNPPPVLIESVLVDDQLQGTNGLRLAAPSAVTIPADKESLEIYYTSLNLSAPEMGSFKYRLEGYETAWTERAGNVRYVRYPKLPPGKYRFRVVARNEDGVGDEVGAALAVTVLPPFWQTWWFISASFLCLLVLVVGSVHYVSTQKLQRQLAVLRQHEALERERARIARDLHDQLGANLTQVALLGEMAESDKDLAAEVESHARQISQTARDTTRALDEIVWTVNPSNDTLDGLVNYVCKYAQEYLALAGLRYRLEVPPQLPALPITPELRHNVFLAAKEAINNIVKHAQATAAWLRLQLEPDRFVLEIEDNGRGLKPADEKKGRNGLCNMRKRMEDVGGSFQASPGAQGGTKVRLTVPLGRTDE